MLNQLKLIVSFVFMFLSLMSHAQDSALKSFFNEKVKEYRTESDSVSDDITSTQPLAAGDSNSVALDSAQAIEDVSLEGGNVNVIDTTSFVKRALAVKKRKPVKEYKDERQWSKFYAITDAEKYKKEHVLNSDFDVFGWHPYWMGTAYKDYNFSLLSTIAYFSYELNSSTGKYKTIHDWKTTSLIDSAKAHGTKVLLSVTNFGSQNNIKFLKSAESQNTLIDELISLLKERQANGVNIDFESIPGSQKENFTTFIIQLSNKLKLANKDYKVTLAIPPIDYNRVYDFPQINGYIDQYIIMGYEFYGINSKVAGPVSPIGSGQYWWDYNLQSALDEYVLEGIPLKKTLMGLPYYGAEWKTTTLKFPSPVKKFMKYPMYRDIKKKYGDLPCCEDEGSKSKYYVYRDKEGEYRQLWYEDSLSLSKKYDWVKEKGIGGVGIWALGYDNGHDELWKLLAAKFALAGLDADKARVKSFFGRYSPRRLIYLLLRVAKNPSYLARNPRPLLGIFGAISGLSLVGFYFIYRYGYRISRTFNVALKGTVILLVMVLIGLIFLGMKFAVGTQLLYIAIGFAIGAIIIMLLSRNFLKEKELP